MKLKINKILKFIKKNLNLVSLFESINCDQLNDAFRSLAAVYDLPLFDLLNTEKRAFLGKRLF